MSVFMLRGNVAFGSIKSAVVMAGAVFLVLLFSSVLIPLFWSARS